MESAPVKEERLVEWSKTVMDFHQTRIRETSLRLSWHAWLYLD